MRAMGTEVTRGRESRIELARRIRTTFLSEEFLLCRATLASMKTETTAPKKMGGDRPRNLKSVGNPRRPNDCASALPPGCSTSANSPEFSRNSRVLLAAQEWGSLWQSTLSVLILVFAVIS